MQCITEHSSGIITRKYRDIIVYRLDIGSNQSTSHVEQISFESVCTYRRCDHGLARDCEKSEFKCCKKEKHYMVMDRIEGFYPTDREKRRSYVK
ncbi:MAG TPA: hypothetical protein VHJ59_08725 [Nitrososphaera sp.]|nr:hypothetical protein [Nitrososphaera sp.]